MEKILLFALLSGGSLIAQPTLTSNDMITVGYTYESSELTNASTADITLTGPNSVWDYSNLTASAANTNQYLSPTGQPGVNNFPESNLCIQSNSLEGSSGYSYVVNSPTAFSLDGAFSNTAAGPTVSQFTPNMDIYRFPLTLNSTFTQPIGGTTTAGIFTYFREGSQTVTCDGFGTLTTTLGTFQNVLRIKTVQIYTDSLNSGGIVDINNYNIINYSWISAASKGIPLLSIVSFTLDNTPPTLFGSMSAAPVLSINEAPSLQFTMFPNPTSEIVNIQLTDNFKGDFQAEIYTVTGKLVQSITGNSRTTSLFHFSTNTLSAGTYLVKLKNAKHSGIQKLIVL
jgi:hypothetical protein